MQKRKAEGGFPGGPVVRTPHFHCRGPGSIPGQGTKILQAERRGKKKKKKSSRQPTANNHHKLIFSNLKYVLKAP